MSVIFMDGFDMYNGANAGTGIPAKWTIPAGNVGTVAGRFGGQALSLNSSNGGDISCRCDCARPLQFRALGGDGQRRRFGLADVQLSPLRPDP